MKIEGYRYLDATVTETKDDQCFVLKTSILMKQCVTIAFEFDTETRELKMGFAYRSPLDLRGSRKKGRMIAKGRLDKFGHMSASCVLKEGARIRRTALEIISANQKDASFMPKWAVDGVYEGIGQETKFSYSYSLDGEDSTEFATGLDECIVREAVS